MRGIIMGFIEIFIRKEDNNIVAEDIHKFILARVEENINLDYKDIQAYSDFDELSRDISAFANSEGGLILLGVSTEDAGVGNSLKKYPKTVTWGSESLSKERLEDNIIGRVHSRIDGLKIVPIRKGDGSSEVIFLIDIPQSSNPPHMAADNRYYK
jgi:predicted HTH transcriptional regulator